MSKTTAMNLDLEDAVPTLDDLAIDKIWTRFAWAKEENDAEIDLTDICKQNPDVIGYAWALANFYYQTQLVEQSVLTAISDKYINRIEKVELARLIGGDRAGIKIILRNEYGLAVIVEATRFDMSSYIKFAGKELYYLATPFDYDTMHQHQPLTVESITHHHLDLLAAKVKTFSKMVETFKEEALV